jgi:hypothetical protein
MHPRLAAAIAAVIVASATLASCTLSGWGRFSQPTPPATVEIPPVNDDFVVTQPEELPRDQEESPTEDSGLLPFKEFN